MSGLALLPGELVPRRAALDLVVATWAEQRTGHLLAGDGGPAVVVRWGDPTTAAGLARIASAMCRGPLRFRAGLPLSGAEDPTRVPLAPLLVAIGRRLGQGAPVDLSPDAGVCVLRHPLALWRLPLRPITRRLLRDLVARPATPMSLALDRAGVPLQDVAPDLVALQALGLIRLAPTARARQRWPRPSDPPPLLDIATGERARLVRQRLDARLDAGVRVQPDLPPLVTPPAGDLHLHGPAPMPGLEAVPEPDDALRMGQEAAVRGDLARARRLLGVGHHQDPDEPVLCAWYGWALVADALAGPTGGGEAARRAGAALLARALSLAPQEPAVLWRALEVGRLLEDPGLVTRAREGLDRADRGARAGTGG